MGKSPQIDREIMHNQRLTWEIKGLPSDLPIQIDQDVISFDHSTHELHAHECLEVGICHDGSGVFLINDRLVPFSAGSISVIDAGDMHFARSSPGTISRWTWIFVNPEQFVPDGVHPVPQFSGPSFPYVFPKREGSRLDLIVEAIKSELEDHPLDFHRGVRAWMDLFLLELLRLQGPNHEPLDVPQRGSLLRIRPALTWIAEHYQDRLYVDDLAVLCGMSATTFREQFQKAMGTTPVEYVNRLRVLLAIGMLADPAARVVDVALAVGFESLSSLNRWFLSVKGQSPRAHRRQMAVGNPTSSYPSVNA